MNVRPYTHCRRRQYNQISILLLKANGATICAFIYDTSCHWRENMPLTLKQIVAANTTDLEMKY